MRDDERRSEAGERRSKGYGFMAFKVAARWAADGEISEGGF